ncbi:type I-C CRISPR-associated protein Cas8c/Csd1 [Prevotella merdae]|uniref:type I-C CRISPR-associated protein Cas8c/Csd1 n=1 Tax=Prevotella merdae TaxID=2079531 RepID=UPI003F81D2F4
MILKALYDYYNRCGEDIAPIDMAYINFYYSIVIDERGNFVRLEPLGDENGLPLLTFRPEERTSAPVPHCMGDNATYLLGLKDIKDIDNFDFAKEIDKNKKNLVAFKKDIEILNNCLSNNIFVKAIHAFYIKFSLETINAISCDSHWKDFCKYLTKNITFSVDGINGYAASDKEIIQVKKLNKLNGNNEAICLITGAKKKPVNTTYSSFILGGKSNAKLVAFQVSSGYDSYGKKMGLNAPISEEAEFKYTTALLKLLSKNSHNKFRIGNRTFIFWASSNADAAQQAEESLFDILGFSEEEQDDPNAKIEQVRKVFTSIYSGTLKTSLDDRFYILGLAPNSARIAVVYWSECSLKEFAGTILRHFNDMEIIDTRKDGKPYMGIKDMLAAVTLNGKQSEATPNLPEAVVKSIFQGTPYPFTLFSACIRRIRAESGNKDKNAIRIARMAIIKAYLNRINDNNKKIDTMLDKSNTNQGYLCGRLFAVLDKIQEDANGISSIRERYMNAASATPASVFATILNLSSHHMEKLANESRRIFYEKIKQEIIDKIPATGFPAHLDLQDQGRFFIGYYHQRQDFFTKKEN